MSLFEIRRSSFLSDAMMHEDHTSRIAGIASDGSRRYSITVTRAQGFEWNQMVFDNYHGGDYDFDEYAKPQIHEIVCDDDQDL